MFYKFNLTDALLFIAFASLVYSEILFLMVMKKPFYRPVGTINTLLWNILTSNKKKKMTDFIPILQE
jgi:hypothetical protein